MIAITGCTTTQAGNPTPAAHRSTYQVPTNGAGTITLPPRPHDDTNYVLPPLGNHMVVPDYYANR